MGRIRHAHHHQTAAQQNTIQQVQGPVVTQAPTQAAAPAEAPMQTESPEQTPAQTTPSAQVPTQQEATPSVQVPSPSVEPTPAPVVVVVPPNASSLNQAQMEVHCDRYNNITVPLTHQVIDTATMDGLLGKAADFFDRATCELYHEIRHDNPDHNAHFAMDAADRRGKFVQTMKAFANGGADLGATVANGAMFVPDIVFGRGNQECEEMPLPKRMFANGALGYAALGTTIVAGEVAEVSGNATGAVIGTLDYVVNARGTQTPHNWFMKHINGVGNTLATATVSVAGFAQGVVLNALRFCSLAAKAAITGVFAGVSAIIGFFVASFRAIFNV